MLSGLDYALVLLSRQQWERVLAALEIAETHYYDDDDHVRERKISEIRDAISAEEK